MKLSVLIFTRTHNIFLTMFLVEVNRYSSSERISTWELYFKRMYFLFFVWLVDIFYLFFDHLLW